MRYAAGTVLLVVALSAAPAPAAAAGPDPLHALRAGVAAREAGDWGTALQDFQAAVKASPGWGLANLELAFAILRTGGSLDAVAHHLDLARKADPDNPRVHYLAGLLAEARHQPQAAAAAYQQAVARRPSLVAAQLRLGAVLLDLGRPAEAIPHLEAAAHVGGRALAARANLADAYEKVGDLEKAEVELKTLVALFPHNAYQLTRLARFYQRHGRTREARRVLRRADAVSGRQKRHLRPLPKSRR